MRIQPILIAAALLLGGTAHAALSIHNSDEVPPNSPWKEHGMPDAGKFNPAGGHDQAAPPVVVSPQPVEVVAPAAMTHYYPPAIVISERAPKPYALVAAPTLPCAPAYCPRRVRVDRN